jgi:hypothetical protein
VAYDEALAQRIRDLVADEPGVVEKSMFGGLAFLVTGNMSVAASGQGGLLIRCAPGDTDALLDQPGAEHFVMRGRAMDGWLRVDEIGVDSDEALKRWVDGAVAYARSLPPK